MAQGAAVGPFNSMISRPRLLEKLASGRARRLSLVVAPAGYGKTALLEEWARALTDPVVYYPLSAADNDPAHFLAGLVAGVRAAIPRCALPEVAEAHPSLSYPLALLFESAHACTGHEWAVLLDDYHLIANPAVHQALETLLSLPAWPAHLVIAGRNAPPLAAIARLRVEGRLLEIDEADLRFTPAETCALLESQGMQVAEDDLRLLLERTEGWPAALQLVCKAVPRETPRDLAGVLERITSGSSLFDYLASQVLAGLPSAVRAFLLHTAPLAWLSPELCDALLKSTDASAVLDDLERGHLFVTRLESPGRQYRYHPLFQEFLCQCLEREEGSRAVREWRLRAAECLWAGRRALPPDRQRALGEAAVEQWLAAQAWTEAADAVEELARLIDCYTAFALAGTWLDRLPADLVACRPRLLLALGQCRERQGRWSEALAACVQVELLVAAGTGDDLLVQALCRQARVRMRLGQFPEAHDLCQRALALRCGACERAEVLSALGSYYAGTDDLERGETCYLESLELYRELGDRRAVPATTHNLAAKVYLAQGRPVEVIEAEQISLGLWEALGSYGVCHALVGLGAGYGQCGEYEAARAALERLLQLADAHGDALMRAYALFLLGDVFREERRFDSARAYYEEACVLAAELRETTLLFEPQRGLALLALAQGDLREACRHAQAALGYARTLGFRLYMGKALAVLGRALTCSGDVVRGGQSLADALSEFERCGAALDQAAVRLDLADLCRNEGRDAEALGHMARCLDLSRRHGYDFLFMKRERERALPLLAQVVACGAPSGAVTWADVDEAARLLRRMGRGAVEPLLAVLPATPDDAQRRVVELLAEVGDERAVPALSRLRRGTPAGEAARAALRRISAQPAPSLRVYALGGFAVFKGDVALPVEAWKRRKARLLLLYLLAHDRRCVPRDELLEALWPDLAPDSAALALNTTFSELRRALEPHLGTRMQSRYLQREDDSFALNPESAAWYDVRAFEEAATRGSAAAEDVLALYRGDFIPEEPYTDWIMRERERLHGLYLNTLIACLEAHMRRSAWREALLVARHLLGREPWLEEVWQAQIACYVQLGRRSEALQSYRDCEEHLRRELDAAPGPITRALYERLKADS